MANYRVAEIFTSINGEGKKAGQLALFIRMQGCNLNCSYCDTKWNNESSCIFHWMSTEEIIRLVRDSRICNVTLTGGEPLIQEEIEELLRTLASESTIQVEVETNGSVNLAPFLSIPNRPSFTMDYKLPGSGMDSAMLLTNFSCLSERDTVKFVVKDDRDMMCAKEIIDEYHLTDRCCVYLSPVYGEIEPKKIVDFMKRNRMNGVMIQLQMQKVIWSPRRRGV